MIDHVLGRPSNKFRKLQVLSVMIFWSFYLLRGNKNGPPLIRKISTSLSRRLSAWQTVVITMMILYLSRNFGKILGLECPEPLANLYTPSYFRATWVLTALDAGYWTAMPIRKKWLRDFCGPLFSVYYLFATEQADEKVRKVRATVTLDHLRVSWNKTTTPYLSTLSRLLGPKLGVTPRHIKIARPKESAYRDPINAVLYFEGTRAELYQCRKVILDFPGGGFVAMTPRNHDDKLCAWARKLGVPIISVDYKKAPEYPYPYALNECYDVYHSIVFTNGQCVGLSGETRPRIAIVGDSAGGNFAVGVTLMICNTVSTNDRYRQRELKSLPLPDGLVLIYPSLDMNIGSWMSEEQMSLIRDRQTRKTNKNVVRRKSEYFAKTSGIRSTEGSDSDSDYSTALSKTKSAPVKAPSSVTLSSIQPSQNPPEVAKTPEEKASSAITGPAAESTERKVVQTRLATTSRISYFNDRILTPEMMRAMVILYVGPHNRPDFTTDFLLSPIVAPDSLLAMFPKCYFLTGERDPLVDDTVIFAGRLRRAKLDVWKRRREMGVERGHTFDEKRYIEVSLIPGISHGFLQMCGVFPGAWREIFKCAKWLGEILEGDGRVGIGSISDGVVSPTEQFARKRGGSSGNDGRGRGKGRQSSMSEDERPLEMSMSAVGNDTKGKKGRAEGYFGGRGSNVVDIVPLEKEMRSKSQMSLGSDDDLVGRRMEGLTSGLGGVGV